MASAELRDYCPETRRFSDNSLTNAVNTEKVAYHKSAQDWQETEKIGLNDIILK